MPFLGDLPGVGRLFQSEGVTNSRTNLMVFIRPTVVRDSEDVRMTTSQRYRYIRAQELMSTGAEASNIDRFVQDVLGTVPPAQ